MNKSFVKSYLPLSFISIIIVLSGIFKLITLSDVTDELYKFLIFTPIGIVDYDLLYALIKGLSIVELLLGVLILLPGKVRVISLYSIFFMLFCFLFINVSQILYEVEYCSCMGSIIKLTPKVTMIKTLLLLVITSYCIIILSIFGYK